VTPRQRLLAARAAFVAIVLLATLSDLEPVFDLAEAGHRLARAFTPSLSWRDAIDGVRNLTLFGGLGVVWIVASLTGKVKSEVAQATLVGFALSALVEGLQAFSPVRTSSIVDVTTNTLGAFLGAAGTALLLALVARAKGRRSYLGVPAFLLAGAYAVAVLCEAATPLFSSEPLQNLEGGPFTRLSILLRLSLPLSAGEIPMLDVPLLIPAGFLAVMALAELGWNQRRAWLVVATLSALVVIPLHVLHGALGIPVRWEAAATDVIAIAFGAWAAQRWLAPITQLLRGSARARAAIFAGALALVAWGWRPFLPKTDFRSIAEQILPSHFVPLASLAMRADIFSALHVAQQFSLYLPLGALLAVWPLRRTGWMAHLLPGVLLAAGIEIGHIVILERFFDVTNALLAWSGLLVGWIVVRRCGYAAYGEALPAVAPRREMRSGSVGR